MIDLPDDIINIIGEFADIFSLAYLRQSCKHHYTLLKEIAERRNPRICEIEIKFGPTLSVAMSIFQSKENITYGLKELEIDSTSEILKQWFKGYYPYISTYEWEKYLPRFIQNPKWDPVNNDKKRWIWNDNYYPPEDCGIIEFFGREIGCKIFITKNGKI